MTLLMEKTAEYQEKIKFNYYSNYTCKLTKRKSPIEISVYVLLPYFPLSHPTETMSLPILGYLRSFAFYVKM